MYSKRTIKFVFVNETSSFDESGNNTITIDQVKSTVSFQSAGNLFGTQVSVSLFGLSIELLAALSSKAMGLFGTDTERISMKIFVGETSVFAGYMTSSIANMNSIPNTSLMITATANADLQNKPASPFSFNGATPVTGISHRRHYDDTKYSCSGCHHNREWPTGTGCIRHPCRTINGYDYCAGRWC